MQVAGSALNNRLGRLTREGSILFVCDLQERFRSLILRFPAVVRTAKLMMSAAPILGIPVMVTEQYKKALGPT
ncbi:isochorismatase domain-containing protein mitochondrial, partial [Cystoisospora suis]